MEEKVAFLVKVDSAANNNKYYKMFLPADSLKFSVEYGRVGSKGMMRYYPASVWYKKYQEKIDKGYIDQTELNQVFISPVTQYKEIENVKLRNFVENLLIWANQKIDKSYSIASKNVTHKMITQAQWIINDLYSIKDIEHFNNSLLKLFATLPRSMRDVSDYLAKTSLDFNKIIQDEQELLDVMKGQVDTDTKMKVSLNSQKTILEIMGLSITSPNADELEKIKRHLGSDVIHMKNVWKVINNKTEENFQAYCRNNNIQNSSYLYHGSRNSNFWNILINGLLLNPNAVITGKMFGHGIYFASKPQKSRKYTSLNGYYTNESSSTGLLAIYKVALGDPLHVYSWDRKYLTFSEKSIRSMGKNSLFAHKGISLYNDEVIVYNEAAATIRYLIELQ